MKCIYHLTLFSLLIASTVRGQNETESPFERPPPDYCLEDDEWLPYEKVVTKCDYASWYYPLGDQIGLHTSEWSSLSRKMTPTMLATDTRILPKAMFPYECENSNALDLSTNDSHVFGETVVSLSLEKGWTIDGWLWLKYSSENLPSKNVHGGERTQTIISSWGMHARNWKLFVDERDSLAFSWNSNPSKSPTKDKIRTCRTEERRISGRRWHYFTVKYDPADDLITLWLNGTEQRADVTDSDLITCTGLSLIPIKANNTARTSIGATMDSGISSDNFVGAMAKIGVYNHPLAVSRMAYHYNRAYGPVLPSPCNGRGECVEESETAWKCACQPIWFGDRCTSQIQVTSVDPPQGSMFGGTQITIKGAGFELLKPSDPTQAEAWKPEVRIGPTITHHDHWAGVHEEYGPCTVVHYDTFTIICETGAWSGRGPQNVSIVAPEPTGVPKNRPVFSVCGPDRPLSLCQFLPAIDSTPRVWTHERWATPGSVLSFSGQNFLFDNFTLHFGAPILGLTCELMNYTDSSFSCKVPDTPAAKTAMTKKRFQMHLKMQPLGYAFPMLDRLYVHPEQLTIYPLYRLDQSNRNCPNNPAQVVVAHSTDYLEPLINNEVRIYEAPCTRRRIAEYQWLRDKVTTDYWKTYGMEGCPPFLRHFHDTTFIPSAFALVPENQVDWNKRYKQRQFVDATGNRHCLFMEEDTDPCDDKLYDTPTEKYYFCINEPGREEAIKAAAARR